MYRIHHLLSRISDEWEGFVMNRNDIVLLVLAAKKQYVGLEHYKLLLTEEK